ncbi:hypothetical protein [Emcibacter sp. SYSU 3D8]|uniref:hypothetical protein n=1 Tax=Emcibacter sp. SYSU 3D8 TaxID=3133969 RepID=UPI0031FED4A4
MKRFVVFAGLVLAISVTVSAAVAGTYQDLLQRMPALPATVEAASAMWVPAEAGPVEGTALKAAQKALDDAQHRLPGAQSPSAQQAQAPQMTPLVEYYATPKGQAELEAMPLDQKMAVAQRLAQEMNPQVGRATAVSDGDSTQIEKIQTYPEATAVRQKLQELTAAQADLDRQWRADEEKLAAQQAAETKRIPICDGEAADRDPLAMRNLALSYVPKHIALARTYLPRHQPLLVQMRAAIAPEIAHADMVVAAWSAIQAPAMRQRMAPVTQGAASAAIVDAGHALAFVRQVTERIARVTARKAEIERYYAGATGC